MEATQSNTTRQAQEPGMRSTTLRVARAKRASARSLPERVGRRSRRVLRCSVARQTHPNAVRPSVTKGGRRARTAQDGHGQAHHLSLPHQSSIVGPVRVWTDRQARQSSIFLFRRRQWTEHRAEMLQCTEVTSPSTWEESHHQGTRTGSRTCKRCGHPYNSQYRQHV